MARKSKGRQKVEMVKMQNESNLQVTFSKRRLGLFKKASELCTLCGVEIAIIVFSPGKKVFSFGHPSVDTLIDRLSMRNHSPNSVTLQLVEAHRNIIVQDLISQLTQVNNQLEHEKKRGEGLDKMRRDGQMGECWWECPLEELEQPRLEQLKVSLEELKNKVAKQTERMLIQSSNPNPPPPPHYFHGNSSFQSSNPNPPPPPNYFHGNSSFQSGIIPYDSKANAGYPLNPNTLLPHQHNLGYGRGFF